MVQLKQDQADLSADLSECITATIEQIEQGENEHLDYVSINEIQFP